jgi:hypothetical protein
MQLLASRMYPFIDSESLEEHQARDTLFRTSAGAFVLHLSSSHRPNAGDRLGMAQLPCRVDMDQQQPEDFGAEWE